MANGTEMTELRELAEQTKATLDELVGLVKELHAQGRQQIAILSTHTLILTQHTQQLQTIDDGVKLRSNGKDH